VTLISSFRSFNGTVLCADSQETVTYYDANGNPYDLRKSVQKISPTKIGKYQIAIAGSGNAPLIESFIVRAKRAVEVLDNSPTGSTSPAGIAAIRDALERELATFYANDVAVCPDADKSMKLFIAAACPLAQQCALWVSENIVLRDAASPELIGWEHEMYYETAKRLGAKELSLPQAVLASIYTLTIAKQTSNYVGGPLSVVIIREDGIWPEVLPYIQAMEDRLSSYESQINELFLRCADTATSVPELEDYVEQFKKTVLSLHRDYIDQQAENSSIADLMSGNPLQKLPKGPIYIMAQGNLKVEHDRDEIQRSQNQWKRMQILGNGGPIKVAIRCTCGVNYTIERPSYKNLFEMPNAPCPQCKKANQAYPATLDDIII